MIRQKPAPITYNLIFSLIGIFIIVLLVLALFSLAYPGQKHIRRNLQTTSPVIRSKSETDYIIIKDPETDTTIYKFISTGKADVKLELSDLIKSDDFIQTAYPTVCRMYTIYEFRDMDTEPDL